MTSRDSSSRESISADIIKRITEYTDIKAENILVCATHLHTGAPVATDTFLKADEVYIEMKGGYVMTNPDIGNPDIIEPCTEIDPTVFESTLPTCIFEPETGHLMTDKLCEMADKLANI